MPVSIGVQWPTLEEAVRCRRGDIRLVWCRTCGFIWNDRFDPGNLEYSQRYDNSLDFSPVFREFADGLAQRLINSYGIRGKKVIEIGCGKGYFLSLLCQKGDNHGLGFDPSYEGARMGDLEEDKITYIEDFYGEKYAQHRGDLVCCRHVLEHIVDPMSFLDTVRGTMKDTDSCAVYFEVPNVRFILEKFSIWDIIYEHCNYFSSESLGFIFEKCGFEVLGLEEAFGGQFLSIDAKPVPPAVRPAGSLRDLSELGELVDAFAIAMKRLTAEWEGRLEAYRNAGQRVVLWGGGSKGVSFLNLLKNGNQVDYVVDINPYKQGRHIPGTGQKIVAPEELKGIAPDIVILMNPIYRGEVGGTMNGLGVSAEIVAVG
ncbi:MAG: methyltransferase domain-containing protein [Opitutaceae bacterium]